MVLKAEQEKVRKEFEVFIKKKLLETWTAQGHFINGKVVKEMDLVVERTLDTVSFLFFSLPYGVYIESGVPSSKIPFSGIGGGGKSAYIEGLIRYALKKLNVGSMQEAKSAAFGAFLRKIFHNSDELIRYVQMALGYSITGSQDEIAFFFCHGTGWNGKGTLLGACRDVLGADYSDEIDPTAKFANL